MKTIFFVLLSFSMMSFTMGQQGNPFHPYTLIAHRGGVVSEEAPENSLAALDKAIESGYYMVEVDMRITKDSVLITQHDPHFKRYFDLDRQVSEMTWEEIKQLTHPSGHRIMLLEEILAHCEGKIQVMLDNKILGFDERLFMGVVALLRKYNLHDEALMIGSSASTEFFTGKVRLSCTREQLEQNQKRADYYPQNYYLFARDLSRDDVVWAEKHEILTVAPINAFTFRQGDLMEAARQKTEELKTNGVLIYQIDGIFEELFR